jgi:hypothetical protein
MEKKYYTLEEAAKFLRMPEGTFRRHLPKITRSKLGKRWIFSEENLIKFVEANQSKPIQELQPSDL